MNGNDHDGQDDAGRQDADPDRRPGEQRPQHRHRAERGLQRLLHVSGQDGREHHQAPHAVDDRRNRGQQLDRGAQRALQPPRRQLGQEQRNAETDGHGDDQRDQRRHQRAVDHHQAAELLLHRIPLGCPQERQAELAYRRPGPDDERNMIPASSSSVRIAAPRVRFRKMMSPSLPERRAGGPSGMCTVCASLRKVVSDSVASNGSSPSGKGQARATGAAGAAYGAGFPVARAAPPWIRDVTWSGPPCRRRP